MVTLPLALPPLVVGVHPHDHMNIYYDHICLWPMYFTSCNYILSYELLNITQVVYVHGWYKQMPKSEGKPFLLHHCWVLVKNNVKCKPRGKETPLKRQMPG
jgi:hypothetical protein